MSLLESSRVCANLDAPGLSISHKKWHVHDYWIAYTSIAQKHMGTSKLILKTTPESKDTTDTNITLTCHQKKQQVIEKKEVLLKQWKENRGVAAKGD